MNIRYPHPRLKPERVTVLRALGNREWNVAVRCCFAILGLSTSTHMIKITAVPMHKEEWRFAAATIAPGFLWGPLFWIGCAATIRCDYLFRDPVRAIAQKDGLVLSFTDGVVSLLSAVGQMAVTGKTVLADLTVSDAVCTGIAQ